MKTIKTAVAWLIGCKGTRSVTPVKVTIGKHTMDGVSYTQDIPGNPTARNKDGHTRRAILVLGDLPKDLYKRRRDGMTAVCFPHEGEDWYVAGGWCDRLLADFGQSTRRAPAHIKAQHPTGPYFLLMPWEAPGAIDQYAEKPCERLPMAVEPSAALRV